MELVIRSPAPDFSLPDQSGKTHKLSDYLGKWVVLYFYPKDETPGCTKEACGFRDIQAEFSKLNTVVLGVSKDSVSSHKKFAEKYHLNFPLLSDESKTTLQAYSAWQVMFVKRITYLINPEGNISKVYSQVDPITHPEQIFTDIKSS